MARGRQRNGLVGFAIHADDPRGKKAFSSLAATRPTFRAFASIGQAGLKGLDPETAALHHLDHALESDTVKSFERPKIRSAESDFKSLGASATPLTGTTIVKFRQLFNKVPVYGSLVTVELDKNNECIGINSSMGKPQGVDHIASVSPARALAVAARAAGQPAAKLAETPRLYYYFHQDDHTWRLAYIVEDVPQRQDGRSRGHGTDALRKDYVVDAHDGRMLAELPRTPTLAAVKAIATDGLAGKRTIGVERLAGGNTSMRNTSLNVATYDFGFKELSRQWKRLPGTLFRNPPSPWPATAVSAHANAEEVARFLRTVLKRNGIDNKGGAMTSSVNCWDRTERTRVQHEWKNAYWDGQMVYGQIRYPDGSFHSVANMLDIVAHEMFHGVTDYTSRLEYRTEAGALNESYSDIFGAIVANYARPLDRWSFELGNGFDGPGTALRDMRNPSRHGQPKKMKDFKRSRPPYTFERNDWGWVHDNSGIHNYAAQRIMTAKSKGKYLFKPREIAAIFYIALTEHLSRTSLFTDSRRAVVQAARSLFRNDAAALREAKLKAVERGFTAAGIS